MKTTELLRAELSCRMVLLPQKRALAVTLPLKPDAVTDVGHSWHGKKEEKQWLRAALKSSLTTALCHFMWMCQVHKPWDFLRHSITAVQETYPHGKNNTFA